MLRKAHDGDFDFVYTLYMHPRINPFLLYDPMSPEVFRPIFDDLLRQNIKFVFEHDGKPAGMCKLVPFQHRTRHVAFVGGVAIHPDMMGLGLGTLMFGDIIDYLRGLGILRIELSTAAENTPAISLYEKCGFRKEGVLRQYTYLADEDRFIDEIQMAYIVTL
jgi:putative acetyltransferase